MSDDPLDQDLKKLKAEGPKFVKGLEDANVRPAIILLAEAVRRLDVTSSKLAKVNLGLTIMIVILTVVQIALTVCHH
jgi:hypothetical protein